MGCEYSECTIRAGGGAGDDRAGGAAVSLSSKVSRGGESSAKDPTGHFITSGASSRSVPPPPITFESFIVVVGGVDLGSCGGQICEGICGLPVSRDSKMIIRRNR